MKIVDAILEVFERENNKSLDYNEIYSKIDKSIFSDNKYGERGKRSIIYRALSGNNDIFSADKNSRPKKFYIVPSNRRYRKTVEGKYNFGESFLYLKDDIYKEISFPLEDDFENEVKNNYKLIFGKDSYYYDIKKKIGRRICDGLVFDKASNKVIIVENEIFIHDLWAHIVPQIIDFFNEMKEERNKNTLKYDVLWNKSHKIKIYEAIDRGNYDIAVVIDKIEFETKKVLYNIRELTRRFNGGNGVHIYFKEFKTYSNERNEKVYLVQ